MHAALTLALLAPLAVDPAGSRQERTLELLANGGFDLPAEPLADDPGAPAVERIPWWTPVLVDGDDAAAWDRAERGWVAARGLLGAAGHPLPRLADGGLELPPLPGLVLTQPLAVDAARAGDVELSGTASGAGLVVLRDGAGGTWQRAVGDPSGAAATFRFRVADLLAEGEAVRPRLTLGLAVAPGAEAVGPVTFDDLAARVAPPPTAALAAELEALVAGTLDQLHEAGRDRFGPRETAFWVGLHDVDTGAFRGLAGRGGGEARPVPRVGLSPLNGIYLRTVALGVGGDAHRARFEELTRLFLEACLHPDTGLPRRYDPLADAPLDGEPVEVAAYLEHLIDLANGGVEPGHGAAPRRDLLPQALHDRAFDAALAMGRRLAEVAVQPDGSVAALLRPSDGRASTSVVHLRRLDVPAQLVRLAGLLRDRDLEPELRATLVEAAREAVLEVEYANLWPGTWRTIDPGWDDTYGHLGERSVAMAAAWPDEPAFARLARTGRAHFAPLWRQALWHGGNVAADQVRCWRILAELDELDRRLGRAPFRVDGLDTGDLLLDAAHNHLIGEQTTDGAWLDVTVVGHDPATNLPVGDVIGLPQNLLVGLGVARTHLLHTRGAGTDTERLEAAFAIVLASTVEAYGASHGFAGGDRGSGGSVRILPGLVTMLESLREG